MQLKIRLFADLVDLNESDLSNKYELSKSKFYMSGNLDELGNSNLFKAVELDAVDAIDSSKTLEWTKTIQLNESRFNEDKKFYYKYFMAQPSDDSAQNGKFFLNQIETGWRQVQLLLPPADGNSECVIELNDNLFDNGTTAPSSSLVHFGLHNGWLLNNECEIQLHFFDSPLKVCAKKFGTGLQVAKVEIVPTNCSHDELSNYVSTQSSFNEQRLSNSSQGLFNAFNQSDVFTILRIRTHEKPKELALQLKFFKLNDANKPMSNENMSYFATSYLKISKTLIENSIEEVDLPVLDAETNKIIGDLKSEVILITSLNEPENYNIGLNYNYDFNQQCILIGHRGMGKTFDAPSLPNISEVENTIESFSEAFKNGAQMVEFDVVLTKDKVPVVYHDFSFCIKHSDQQIPHNFIDIPAIHMTYDEIKRNRIYSHKILKEMLKSESSNQKNEEFFSSSLMFPTLDEMFAKLDTNLGFDVEIKYPCELEDGTNEVDPHLKWPNRNEYADIIVRELYKCVEIYGNKRFVILTTFDPNLCSMFRLKQNKFPVLFLTNGLTKRWVPYKDPRCRNISFSYNFAKSESFQGFVPHAEELVKDLSLLSRLKTDSENSLSRPSMMKKFLSISWGDDLNNLDNRKLLMSNGIHGIIYDRINESPNSSSAHLTVATAAVAAAAATPSSQSASSLECSPEKSSNSLPMTMKVDSIHFS